MLTFTLIKQIFFQKGILVLKNAPLPNIEPPQGWFWLLFSTKSSTWQFPVESFYLNQFFLSLTNRTATTPKWWTRKQISNQYYIDSLVSYFLWLNLWCTPNSWWTRWFTKSTDEQQMSNKKIKHLSGRASDVLKKKVGTNLLKTC